MPDEDKETRASLLADREKYRFLAKMAPTSDGDVKMMCPAEGQNATADCPLKALHPKASKKKDRVVILNPPKEMHEACQQHVVTMTLQDESRWVQPLSYKSPEWKTTYATDRNTIEGYNGYIKDPDHQNLDASGRRRMRGLTAQQFIVTMLLVSANMRKVYTFLREDRKPEEHKRPLKRRRRAHLSLRNYETRLTAQVAEYREALERNKPMLT